jgi:hypothetical protein
MRRLVLALIPSIIAAGSLSTLTALADDADSKINMDQLPAPARSTIEARAQGGRVEEIAKLSDDNRLFKAEVKKGDRKDYLYVNAAGKVVGEHIEK